MNLAKKKQLAARALKVGKNRIVFNKEGFSEIKEAITKEDVKTLFSEGIITIKPVKGRKKIKRRKTRRGPGKIKKKVKNRKQTYVKITRKLRAYLKELKNQGKINKDLYRELRKKIKMRAFRSKMNLKEHLNSLIQESEKEVKKEKTKKNRIENKTKGPRTKAVKSDKVKNLKEDKR